MRDLPRSVLDYRGDCVLTLLQAGGGGGEGITTDRHVNRRVVHKQPEVYRRWDAHARDGEVGVGCHGGRVNGRSGQRRADGKRVPAHRRDVAVRIGGAHE